MITQADLAHLVHPHAVYFVLGKDLDRDSFLWVLHALAARAGRSETESTPEDHWRALQERIAGSSRWDAVMPRFTDTVGFVEAAKRMRASRQSFENILRLRRFTGYLVEGLRYTLDVFNPGNELEMPYLGAGEPVVALLMQGLEFEPGPISNRLVENDSFYEILKDLDGVLHPEYVCGTHASTMMSVLWAYLDGRASPGCRPWEFLFPLHVLKNPPIPLTPETRISGTLVGMLPGKDVKLAKVEDWGGGRVLTQINAGLDSAISWEYFAVAKALGMTAVQQLAEGTAK